MSFDPPFVPETRKEDEDLHERVARARKAREEAAKRVERLCANIEPDKRKWRVRDPIEIGSEPTRVR